MTDTDRYIVPAGTHGFYVGRPHHDEPVTVFEEETVVTAEIINDVWVKTTEPVTGCDGCPPIMLRRDQITMKTSGSGASSERSTKADPRPV